MTPHAINGVTFLIEPESASWDKRDEAGYDGEGRPVYPGLRKYEMEWGLMSPDEFLQVHNFYTAVSQTGTCVATLPMWRNPSGSYYVFYAYSGCTMSEPSVGKYFVDGHVEDVKLLILRVRT